MNERTPQSADTTIDGALDTLQRLDTLGEFAYAQNAATLITEAAARAAIADAITNRIRLLHDLLYAHPTVIVFPGGTRADAVDEYERLVRSVVRREA